MKPRPMEKWLQPPSDEMLLAMLAEAEAERIKMLTQIQAEYAKENSTQKDKGVDNAPEYGQRH